MKKTIIKASLMTKQARLVDFDIEVTENDFRLGLTHIYEKAAVKIYEKAAVKIRERLNIIIDEDNLKEVFG